MPYKLTQIQLRGGLMVGQQTLNLLILVRIQASELIKYPILIGYFIIF